jgi:hypothetical protein
MRRDGVVMGICDRHRIGLATAYRGIDWYRGCRA